MVSKYKYLLFFGIGFVVFCFSQFVAFLISKQNIFVLKNEKIIFFFSSPYLLSIIFLALIVFILFSLWEIKKEGESLPLIISLGLILGGGFSNIFDRLRLGGVTDYLNMYFWKMNLADLLIFVGVFIFILLLFKKSIAIRVDRRGED